MDEYAAIMEEATEQEEQPQQEPVTFLHWLGTHWGKVAFALIFWAVCAAIWTLGGCFDSTSNDDLITDENRKSVGMLRDVVSVLRDIVTAFILRMNERQ